jgi:hypothetical protein
MSLLPTPQQYPRTSATHVPRSTCVTQQQWFNDECNCVRVWESGPWLKHVGSKNVAPPPMRLSSEMVGRWSRRQAEGRPACQKGP